MLPVEDPSSPQTTVGSLLLPEYFVLEMMCWRHTPSSLLSICVAVRLYNRPSLETTKEQLVGSKYIVGLCGLVLAELFAAAALGVASLHWTAVDHALVVSTLVQVGMTTLLNSAVLLPLNYRFGYEKAKYAFYFMVGLVAALMGFGVSANEDGLARNLLPQGVPPLALLGIAVAALALYALSWRLSVAWYGKAEQ